VRSDDEGEEVTKVIEGGPVQYGQAVRFELALADGTMRRFHCRWDRYPKLLQGLRAFGQIAEKARAGMVPTSLDAVDPYRVTEAPRSGLTIDGQTVVLSFQTTEGVPVMLAMTRDAAQATISELSKALAQSGPKYDPRS
jgi:hypothetical protein